MDSRDRGLVILDAIAWYNYIKWDNASIKALLGYSIGDIISALKWLKKNHLVSEESGLIKPTEIGRNRLRYDLKCRKKVFAK